MPVKTYQVARAHDGDRFYRAGETRDLDSGDAGDLLRLGVLVDPDGQGGDSPRKTPARAKSKAEGAAPENKAGDAGRDA